MNVGAGTGWSNHNPSKLWDHWIPWRRNHWQCHIVSGFSWSIRWEYYWHLLTTLRFPQQKYKKAVVYSRKIHVLPVRWTLRVRSKQLEQVIFKKSRHMVVVQHICTSLALKVHWNERKCQRSPNITKPWTEHFCPNRNLTHRPEIRVENVEWAVVLVFPHILGKVLELQVHRLLSRSFATFEECIRIFAWKILNKITKSCFSSVYFAKKISLQYFMLMASTTLAIRSTLMQSCYLG